MIAVHPPAASGASATALTGRVTVLAGRPMTPGLRRRAYCRCGAPVADVASV